MSMYNRTLRKNNNLASTYSNPESPPPICGHPVINVYGEANRSSSQLSPRCDIILFNSQEFHIQVTSHQALLQMTDDTYML